MELLVQRLHRSPKSTIGQMSVNNDYECFTLEDIERDVKIKHQTAIPKGRYEVAVSYSNRFHKLLPILLNVPGFEAIRIHSGNTKDDTSGCILVGETKGVDFIGNSRVAFNKLMPKIKTALKKEKVFITVQ